MKKLLHKAVFCVGAVVALAGSALAEGASEVSSSLVTTFINDGKSQVVSVLSAGAAIVGAFFIWGLIKRALRASK